MPVEQVRYTPGKVMQVRVISGTRLNDKHYDVGRILEVPEQNGLELIHSGKAVRHVEEKPGK